MELSEQAEALRGQAETEARQLGHRYVSTEHLLLAIARNASSRLTDALVRLEVEPSELIEQIYASVAVGSPDEGKDAIPFSPRVTKTFERALSEAAELGGERAEPEHVLIALLEDEESVAAQVLEHYGVDYASTLGAVRRIPD